MLTSASGRKHPHTRHAWLAGTLARITREHETGARTRDKYWQKELTLASIRVSSKWGTHLLDSLYYLPPVK